MNSWTFSHTAIGQAPLQRIPQACMVCILLSQSQTGYMPTEWVAQQVYLPDMHISTQWQSGSHMGQYTTRYLTFKRKTNTHADGVKMHVL